MYGTIPEVSPGAAKINEAIRLRRAQERARVIGRAKHLNLNLSARLAIIADREGVIGGR